MSETTQQPLLINIDWLSFSVTLALDDIERLTGRARLIQPQGYVLVEATHGTPQYKRRVLVQTEDGDKVLTLLLQPYSKIMDSRDMFVEVANSRLYDGHNLGWVLDLLGCIHVFAFKSLSRYDVACDFNPTEDQRDIISALTTGGAYVSGKREGVSFHNYNIPTQGGRVTRVARQLSWGSKFSAVKWKLYNKTLEIMATDEQGRRWCAKPWIPTAWARAGMETREVWRLECSVVGASTFDWRGEKCGWQLADAETAESFYWSMLRSRFTIRANEGHACRKNDRELQLLPVPQGDTYRLRERIGETEQITRDHAATLRACIKELEREENAFSATHRAIWLDTTNRVIEAAHLHDYFLRTFGKTWEEYAAEVGQQSELQAL